MAQWQSSEGNFTKIRQVSINKVSLKITHLKFHSNFPGDQSVKWTHFSHNSNFMKEQFVQPLANQLTANFCACHKSQQLPCQKMCIYFLQSPFTFEIIGNQYFSWIWILWNVQILLQSLFVKLAELHIVTARKPLIHQNQPVAHYLHKIQPCML